MLKFNQALAVIQKNQGEKPFYLMEIEDWTREQLIDFLEQQEGVNKLEVTQESDNGIMITDGNVQFMVTKAEIVDQNIQ